MSGPLPEWEQQLLLSEWVLPRFCSSPDSQWRLSARE
jgi:hypothetical protein